MSGEELNITMMCAESQMEHIMKSAREKKEKKVEFSIPVA
jgi:hypothetical protein